MGKIRLGSFFWFLQLLSAFFIMLNAHPALSENSANPVYEKAGTAYVSAPVEMDMEWSSEAPRLTDEQMERLNEMMERIDNLPGSETPSSGAPVVGPTPGTESSSMEGATADPSPSVTSAPILYTTKDLHGVAPSGYQSNVLEPAFGQIGKYIFYTGNWFAARSANQGVTWTYVNPYSGFSDFCCDQDVIYDKTRDRIIWLRMGSANASGENVFKLGVSSNGGATFCNYTFAPKDVDASWTGVWWDYPNMALTNNYLYITWHLFNASDVYQRQVVLRMPLEALANCSGFGYGYYSNTAGFGWAPAHGGTSKFYWAHHIDTDTIRIYTWQEFSGSISYVDRDIPAWTATGRYGAHCAAPDGNDACQRFDDRVMGGYVKRHSALAFSQIETVGFWWNVKEGSGFTYPYSNNAWFYTNTMNYGGRAYIWTSSMAIFYPASYPDRRGNIGIVANIAGSNTYPSLVAMKDDDTDGIPPGYTWTTVATGNHGPSDDKWGDYNRVRPFQPIGTCWAATGHVLRDGTSGNYVHPYYVIFGNPRDYNSAYLKWRQEP